MNPPKPVICNTTLLSNLALVNRVDLLPRALARPLFTTPQVIDEISAGVQAGYAHLTALEALLLSDASLVKIISLANNELATFRDMRLRLHAGEASCLAIAWQRNYTLGTDDLAARKVARAKQVAVIGTIGVLVKCQHGLVSLDEANAMLQRMIEQGYRSPVPRLDDFWK